MFRDFFTFRGKENLVGNAWDAHYVQPRKQRKYQLFGGRCRDEARHGKGFEGMLKRYFG